MREAAFWKDRRVFVTGHTGFKGAWLTLWLTSLGADVAGYALEPPTTPSLFDTARIGDGIRSTVGDVADRRALRAALAAHRPEIIFHLAAQALVRRSYADPVETFATNVMGTVHLLDAARAMPDVRAIVVATSDKCYDNRESPQAYRESDPMGGRDPYSASKGATEIAVAAMRNSFFSGAHAARVATVRAGNVIGGGDWAVDRLVPDVIRASGKGTAVTLRYPRATRPWQHVLDALNGYLMLAERLASPQGADFARGWNFGPAPEDLASVESVVARLCALLGNTAGWTTESAGQPHEAHALVLDSGLARRRLGWRPALTLDESLVMVADWHKAFDAASDMRDVSLGQLIGFTRQNETVAHG